MKNSDLNVLETIVVWYEAGHKVELVTLVQCWGSAPRPVGSLAAIRHDGVTVGSVSGGCVEKELASEIRQDGQARLVEREVSDKLAKSYGLHCGGKLDLVFEQITDIDEIRTIITSLIQRQRICRIVDLKTGRTKLTPADRAQEFSYDSSELKKVFGPSWRLLLIGAGDLSAYVAEMALALDYEVVVCDTREHFIESWKVSGALIDTRSPDDAVIALASDRRSAVLALTHDPNLDDLALTEGLTSDAFYIGALGSRKNNQKRCERLEKFFDITPTQLKRLHGPIGLRIGSITPAEIAVSILAEITAVRYDAELIRGDITQSG